MKYERFSRVIVVCHKLSRVVVVLVFVVIFFANFCGFARFVAFFCVFVHFKNKDFRRKMMYDF